MSFLIFIAAGFFSGLLGGMGMGGGTVLIPVLTLLCGVGQHVAQAANLISFLPMAAFSLSVHKKHGLIKTDGLLWIILPAAATSAFGGLFAMFLPAALLKKLFGFFLIALSVFTAFSALPSAKK